jgi:opacity protein-like surface antigen
MKKLALAAIVAAASISASFAAQAQSQFFVNGNAGQSSYRLGALKHKSSEAYAINAGYRWAITPVFDLGLEGGYTTLGHGSFNGPLGTTRLKVRGWTLGGNAKFNIGEQFYTTARFGNFHSRTGLTTSAFGDKAVFASSDNGWYGGIGAGYNVLPNLSVGIAYDTYHSHARVLGDGYITTGVYSANAEFRF